MVFFLLLNYIKSWKEVTVMSYEKMQCMECSLFSSCPSSTRVFINYCGSMPESLKDQIWRARIDCRVRRRDLKYHGVPSTSRGVSNAVVIPADVNVLEALYTI
jgi:hypothetical protein